MRFLRSLLFYRCYTQEVSAESVVGSTKKFTKRYKHRIDDLKRVMANVVVDEKVEKKFFDRFKLEDLLKRRFFYDQSFAIYGGIAGLYDYGPMGCSLKSNIVQQWRKHFILTEGMLEVECSALTPADVLKASGHVERFIDWMVKDVNTGDCFRADHLIKNNLEELMKKKTTTEDQRAEFEQILARLDGFSDKDMNEVIRKYKFKSPTTGNELSDPVSFNLMFPTQIGPTGDFQAYLRPETAQGIFINFKRLLEFNQGRLPFAAAQIGSGFRNEISPRQGLIRVREFTMCEIEHFVDPADKKHIKFSKVADVVMTLFSAFAQGLVDNETLGYYMARTHLFLVSVGVNPNRLRFRQHMSNEMAHYAKDCWDAECDTSYGWIECVGHADRACYDLSSHHKATGTKLCAEKHLSEPRKVSVVEAAPNKKALGLKYKGEAKQIIAALETLDGIQLSELEKALNESVGYFLNVKDKTIELSKDLVEVKRYEKTSHVEEIVPSVIEPSFGIGRIMYVVLEHNFRQRAEDEKRCYLDLPPTIAPIKCSVLPIVHQERFKPIVESVCDELANYEISHKVDDTSGTIGRRYARTDEIGIPFGITVDGESEKEPCTVTLREIDTTQQIRLKITEVGKLIDDLTKNRLTWKDAVSKYPLFKPE
ncbi:anticodon binding domain-containing protein [Ditylenchus destructor]|uniref:glycine--tRNA ligase n=1 Tax=Ditylenchus destructor TaxID=166010 RepID=A0AAD4NEF0_9BILA|nr:anticodon binding domain-containing protein [Ditylenchus destructor]